MTSNQMSYQTQNSLKKQSNNYPEYISVNETLRFFAKNRYKPLYMFLGSGKLKSQLKKLTLIMTI